jgi:hypothetical protein
MVVYLVNNYELLHSAEIIIFIVESRTPEMDLQSFPQFIVVDTCSVSPIHDDICSLSSIIVV